MSALARLARSALSSSSTSLSIYRSMSSLLQPSTLALSRLGNAISSSSSSSLPLLSSSLPLPSSSSSSLSIIVRGAKTRINKSAKKRFRVTANGLKCGHAGRRHLNRNKSRKQLNNLRQAMHLTGANLRNMKKILHL